MPSDSSASTVYSYDDLKGDTSLSNFSINAAPSDLFSTIKDIQAINSGVHVHVTPWSPVRRCYATKILLNLTVIKPGWMKDSGTMNGGNFVDSSIGASELLSTIDD